MYWDYPNGRSRKVDCNGFSSLSAFALSSLSPLSHLRFHNAKYFAGSPIPLSPCFSLLSFMAPRQPDRSPYVPSARPRDDKHQGPSSLFYDSGIAHGLQRAPSHRIRSFRRPIVYSNPLADLCVIILSFLMVHNLTRSLVQSLIDSNNWDAMFMERLMGGITIHKPVVPPTVILTLGNGFDFWAIHAAQRWHVCIQLLTLRSFGS